MTNPITRMTKEEFIYIQAGVKISPEDLDEIIFRAFHLGRETMSPEISFKSYQKLINLINYYGTESLAIKWSCFLPLDTAAPAKGDLL